MIISIVFPVYNKLNLLSSAIQSILSQSFRDFELIAVDDGSTDGSGEYLDKIAKTDVRIKVIHQENAGVSSARNAALDAAQGDYIVFADADDTVCPNWLEVLVKEATRSSADIVISGFFSVNDKGQVINSVLPENNDTIAAKELLKRFSFYQSNHGMLGFGHGKIVKSKLITYNHIRFTLGLKLAEDLDFFIRLYEKANTISFVRYAGYNYLQEAINSAMALSAYRIDYLSQIRLWINIHDIMCRNDAYNEFNRAFIEQRLANYSLCALLYNSNSKDISIKKLKQFSNTVKKHPVSEKALKPIRFFYLIGSDILCRAYSKLFKKRMKKGGQRQK